MYSLSSGGQIFFRNSFQRNIPSFQFLIYRSYFFFHHFIRNHVSNSPIFQLIFCTNFNRRKNTQHISLHHQQLRHAIDHDRIFQRRQINPATTSGPSGGGSELITFFPHQVALVINKFRRKRTTPNPGAIGLKNTIYFSNMTRRNAKSGACSGRHRV